ncbi:MAG: hypothetical protein RSF81_06185 [Oscillospiraceae bacterium]
MNKLKKITAISGIVFLVCLVAAAILIPISVNSGIEYFNEMLQEDAELSKETIIEGNIKKLNLDYNNYSSIKVRKSLDSKIHIMTMDRGYFKWDIDVQTLSDDETAVMIKKNTSNSIIDKSTIAKSIKSFLDTSYDVIIYMPENIDLVSEQLYLINPYTNQPYENSRNINEVQKEETSYLTMSRIRNEIRKHIVDIQSEKIKFKERNEGGIDEYLSCTNSSYETIISLRTQLVDAVVNRFYEGKSNPEMELLVYKLTEKEQERDIKELEIDIISTRYQDESYSKEPNTSLIRELKNDISALEKEIARLTKQFDDFSTVKIDGTSLDETVEVITNSTAPSSEDVDIVSSPTSSNSSSESTSSSPTSSNSSSGSTSSSQASSNSSSESTSSSK